MVKNFSKNTDFVFVSSKLQLVSLLSHGSGNARGASASIGKSLFPVVNASNKFSETQESKP